MDCPICDQAGECDLQDETFIFSALYSRFYFENKRSVFDKNLGNFVETIMTRCIHCTKCTRLLSYIFGKTILGVLGRNKFVEIGFYTV